MKISVAGRNPHPVIRLCKDDIEAKRVAEKMINEGFKNVTIDGVPFDNLKTSQKGADE